MTVSSETASISYSGDDLTTGFPIPFAFLSNSDIQVATRDDDGDATVITTGFTITGAGTGSGTCTFTTAPAATTDIIIRRKPQILQPTDYVANDAFPAESHETALDRLTMIAQRLAYDDTKALRVPDGDPAIGSAMELPVASSRASKFLYFDADGNPEPATGAVAGTVLSASVIGALVWPRSDAETAASVTPSFYQYPPGDFRRYGAAGDGSTDDTDAVAAAINQSLESGGAIPFGQPGATYLLSTWTTIDTTESFRLGGYGYTLKGPASTTNFLSFGGASLLCEYVTFDRWATVFDRQSSETGTTTLLQVEKNVFTACTGPVINLERPISQYFINDNRFYSNTGGYVIRIGENTYASQDNWLKGTIRGNKIKDTTASSTTSAVAILVYGREALIEGNTIDTVTADSGEAWGIYTKVRYGAIRGNLVRSVDSSGSTDIVGINVKGAGRGVTSGPQGFSVVCEGNQVLTVGTGGTDGNGIRAQTDDVLIRGNFVEDAGLLGIVVDESAGSSNISVENNTVRSGTAASRVGVYIATSGTGIKALNNTLVNVGTGVRVASATSGTLQDVEVVGNTGSGCSQALVDVNTPSTLAGCKVHRNTLLDGARGFLNSGGAGTISGLEIYDNDFDAAATAAIGGNLPTDCAIRHTSTVTTTDATQTAILTLALPDESAYAVNTHIVGKDTATTNRAAYLKHALVYRDGGGGATVQTGVSDVSTIESNAAWNGTIIVSSNSASVAVTGAAGVTVKWKARTEVLAAA